MPRIHFSLSLADHAARPFAKRRIQDLPDWADLACNHSAAAQAVCELFFEPGWGAWERFIGEDQDQVAVIIEIRKPTAMAGRYRVELRRRIEAVRRLELPPQSPRKIA